MQLEGRTGGLVPILCVRKKLNSRMGVESAVYAQTHRCSVQAALLPQQCLERASRWTRRHWSLLTCTAPSDGMHDYADYIMVAVLVAVNVQCWAYQQLYLYHAPLC